MRARSFFCLSFFSFPVYTLAGLELDFLFMIFTFTIYTFAGQEFDFLFVIFVVDSLYSCG